MADGAQNDDVTVVTSSIEQSLAMKRSMLHDDALLSAVTRFADELVSVTMAGGLVLAFGNGGSALEASHLASELIGRFEAERRPLAAVALGLDVAASTAISNDYGYEEVFARQVRGLGRPGGVAVGISTSGRSPNVLAGLAAAREKGLRTVGLTGHDPRGVGALSDVVVAIPAQRTARVQEGHLLVIHLVCELLDRAMSA